MSKDSEDESAFMALSISITTRMESEMVEAVRAVVSEKMEQLISGKLDLQLWKWDC